MRERIAASAVSVRRSNCERASSERLRSSPVQPAAVSASAAVSATHGMGERSASPAPSNPQRISLPRFILWGGLSLGGQRLEVRCVTPSNTAVIAPAPERREGTDERSLVADVFENLHYAVHA